jgi:hypothetical protein
MLPKKEGVRILWQQLVFTKMFQQLPAGVKPINCLVTERSIGFFRAHWR